MEASRGWDIRAVCFFEGDIEGLVLDRLRALFASDAEVSDAVAPLGLDASTQRAVLDRSAKLAERWTTLASLELRELVQSLVQQIQIGDAQISVWLNRTAIMSSVMPNAALVPIDCMPAAEPFVLSITASLRRAGKGVRLVIGNGAGWRFICRSTRLIRTTRRAWLRSFAPGGTGLFMSSRSTATARVLFLPFSDACSKRPRAIRGLVLNEQCARASQARPKD
jgi:hypothetical protein